MLYFENEGRYIRTSPGKLSLKIIGKFGEEAYEDLCARASGLRNDHE